jgi:nicotinamidase-related amidase
MRAPANSYGAPAMPLVDRDDSVLVVIDAQEGFFGDDLAPGDGQQVRQALARMTWLVKVARRLEVPAVVTEEDPERYGATFAPIAAALPEETAIVKPTFAVTGTPLAAERIERTGRATAVLVGFETDVCVAQSAIGLKERGMRVVVVEDAVFSPGEMHRRGLERIVAEGVELNHCKGLAYEWTRTVQDARAVLGDPDVGEPPFRL